MYQKLLFAVPNGGHRHISEAKRLKAEGVRPGVADLMLSIPGKNNHGLYIEMKTSKGKMSDEQKEFARAVIKQGYRYVVCRKYSNFQELINRHIRKQE